LREVFVDLDLSSAKQPSPMGLTSTQGVAARDILGRSKIVSAASRCSPGNRVAAENGRPRSLNQSMGTDAEPSACANGRSEDEHPDRAAEYAREQGLLRSTDPGSLPFYEVLRHGRPLLWGIVEHRAHVNWAELLIGDFGNQVLLLVRKRRPHSDELENQLGRKKVFAQPSRWLKHSATPAASWTINRAGQNPGLFGCNRQVEAIAAAGVLARDAVNDSTVFLLHR
jgi:hypothetical protein